jgi:phosphohistidine phosphatase SixA
VNVLYLVRHSKAQREHPAGDRFRALTAEGLDRIAAMLPRAEAQGFHAQLALSSPFVRAVETRDRFAALLAPSRVETSPAFVPGGNPEEACIELAAWAQQYSSIALFTHNPLVSVLAELLLAPGLLPEVEFHTPTILALGFENGPGLRLGRPLWILNP